jgi:hypothetical protein
MYQIVQKLRLAGPDLLLFLIMKFIDTSFFKIYTKSLGGAGSTISAP